MIEVGGPSWLTSLFSQVLTSDVVARIYMGNISVWNDSAIASLNPDIQLPYAPIQLGYYPDAAIQVTKVCIPPIKRETQDRNS